MGWAQKRPPPPSAPSPQPNRRAKIWLLGIASARPSVPIQRRRLTLPAPLDCILWIGGPTSPTQEDDRQDLLLRRTPARRRSTAPPFPFLEPPACGDDDSGHTADPLTRKPIHPSIPRNHRGCTSNRGSPPLDRRRWALRLEIPVFRDGPGAGLADGSADDGQACSKPGRPSSHMCVFWGLGGLVVCALWYWCFVSSNVRRRSFPPT